MQTGISLAAIILGLVFAVIAVRRAGMSPPRTLSVAVLMAAAVELFDLLVFSDPDRAFFWKKCSMTAEGVLAWSWLRAGLCHGRLTGPGRLSLPMRAVVAISSLLPLSVIMLPLETFIYSPDLLEERVLFLNDAGFYFYLTILLCLVVALVNLESTLVHTTFSTRWKMKFELLGAGAFLVLLIVYYSQGLLFRTINMQLIPARGMVLIVSLALMTYSRVVRGEGAPVRVSRMVVYRSMSLAAVGLYLICLGLLGEGMRHLGDGFQRSLMLSVAVACGLGLFVLFLSDTAKHRIKIFLDRNFYRSKYDYRSQWLQFTERLATTPAGDDLLNSIVTGFCETFAMRSGALFTRTGFESGYALDICQPAWSSPLLFDTSHPLVARMTADGRVIDLRCTLDGHSSDPRDRFLRTHRACFLVPLFNESRLEGFIMLGYPLGEEDSFTHEDFDLMATLASQASSALLNLRLSHQLASSRELAALGRVSAFVMHDLKNLVSATSLMLSNARENISIPEFQKDLLSSLEQTVDRMNTLIVRLKHLPARNSLRRTPVDLLQMAHETAALVKGKKLEITGTHVIAQADREELQKVVLNLMLNAVEATGGSGAVTVEVGELEAPFVKVRDEGCGMPEEFLRSGLFSPFVSTKKKGLGIGLYQSKQIVEAHGGTIEVVSRVHKGSEFTVWLPRMA